MGETTKIEWCDHTFNPWIGCTKVSAACDHCYAESLARRYGWAAWGPGEPRRRTSAANWREPLRWDRAAKAAGVARRVFCASLADWADAEVSQAWRHDLFALIAATPNLEWLLLSKRHALVRGLLRQLAGGITNIRIGMTVETNDMAAIRLARLCRLKEDGWPTFVSYEPALEPIDWDRWLSCIDWLLCGTESGPGARLPPQGTLRDALEACRRHGTPFFMKQLTERGRKLPIDQWPPALRVREFPSRTSQP